MQWKLWHHFISPCCCEWLWEAVYSCTQLCFPLRQTHIDYEVFQITSNIEKLTKKNCLVSRGQQGDIKWIWQVTVSKHHSLHSAGGCCESQVFTWIQKNNWTTWQKRTSSQGDYDTSHSDIWAPNHQILRKHFWRYHLLACPSLTVLTRYLPMGTGKENRRDIC